MLVVATSVSGTLEKPEYEAIEKYVRRRGKNLKFYKPGGEMIRVAREEDIPITEENILDAPRATQTLLQRIALDEAEPLRKRCDALTLLTHCEFPWKKVSRMAWRSKKIAALNPDIFITFISDAERVLERLNQRKQWAQADLSLEDVLDWNNHEVNITKDWADREGKPFYVVPATAPPSFFYNLIFRPEMEIVYASMPLTHAYKRSVQSKVDRLISRLNRRFNMTDPRWIDPLVSSKGKKFDPAVFHNVVERDLYRLIRQSKRLIAYFPEVVLSAGMIDEIVKACEANKEVWLIWPKGKAISPFLHHYVSKLFYSVSELIRYVEKNFPEVG